MLSRCHSIAVFGIEAYPVEVEVDVRGGLPDVTVVGLPDAAVKEARDRVKSALSNSGYANPQHHTIVNLAPADIKKEGPAFDLPIAVGMLAATGQVRPMLLDECVIVGELTVTISRTQSSVTFPCRIMPVGSMNPCPCRSKLKPIRATRFAA